MIYYFSPFDLDGKLGRAYNQCMSIIPNDADWGCLVDGDAMFLTSDYGKQLQNIVDKYPDTGLFTCLTNRVGQVRQCFQGKISDNPDITYHKTIALQLQKEHYDEVEDLNFVISGHLMLMRKATWNANKFSEEGILAVDNKISRKLLVKGYAIRLMKGVYIFHYYRFNEGIHHKLHIKQ